ncbi:ABC transporter ATP-binding protein [Hoeflea sp. BAL378]|uniref:ABC transporter ATP-binding protein n=1 Tax=Hoeflea sp. BAL378 TaxID=1547437 RepID=UPI00068D172E|nr:ABC transporter ATP-binding protein [Hoeflea sp. BAL378]
MQTGQAQIQIENVSRLFGSTAALDDVSVSLRKGEFSVLLGPSGCGKSTLLRLIAGLDAQTSGAIRIGGADVGGKAPSLRELSMVFQSYALFPHLTVLENIVFGLRVRGVAKAERMKRLDTVAAMMGLSQLLARKPSELSGGQQQRVALARAVISERPICLMDEPLSNLDAKLRADMRVELRAIQQALGLTVVYVTHDQIEAMTMADRIIVMNAGRIEQVGTPEEVYARPATVFTAGFIGTPPMNLFPVALFGGRHGVPPGTGKHLVGLRPEDLFLAETGPEAELRGVEYLGADRLVSARLGGTDFILRLPASAAPPPARFALGWAPERQSLFDAASGQRLAGFDFASPSPTKKDFTHETA